MLSVSNAEFVIYGLLIFAAVIFMGVVYSLITRKEKETTNPLDVHIATLKETLPIKLQAYERLTLLTERSAVMPMIKRLNGADLTAPEHQFQMVNAVRQEFEHNLTQQIYVSEEAWLMVSSSIEETISAINNVARQLPTNATGNDLNRALLNQQMGAANQQNSHMAALAQLRYDVRQMTKTDL